ncbi:MAG: hypothetical protein HY253_02450 [Burkholderiales bacterium]|nr:hypothetical protein [Burkholderiales bacterium]
MAFEETIISLRIRQFLPRLLAFACLALFGASSALGLGLGELKLRSFLGQSLQAQLELVGAESEFFNPSCVRVRVVTFDGVFLASANVVVRQIANKRQLLLSTRQHINEPAVNLIVDMNCEMQLHREFSLLLDPPDLNAGPNLHLEDVAVVPVAPASNAVDKPHLPDAKVDAINSRPSSRKRTAAPLAADVSAPENTAVAPSKRQKKVAARDVLRLSDEVELPKLDNGLRMSDVLSSPAGQDLIENIQELRAAQARMAAILRDEPDSKSLPTVDAHELTEINQLKKEAEQLKKQNQVDKASLQQLQSKSSFDYWLLALSIVAIAAILVIVFLLLYIRKNFGIVKPSWWEDEEDEIDSRPPVRIEEVIDQLQAKYDINTGGNENRGEPKVESGAPASGQAASSSLAQDSSTHRTPTLEETSSSIFNFYSPRTSSVKVEEISDVTQEAEFWISMNDPQRAIEILAAQERVEHPDSPVPWLFLLDLYRTVEDREKYEQLRQRFISFFNANIPEYEADLSTLVYRHLDDFPHILEKICALWGGVGALPYLESLLIDDRNGARSGFDLPVYRDLLMLIGIAKDLEKHRLAEEKIAKPVSVSEAKQAIDPVEEADFGTIDFEMIEFPLTDPDAKKNS